MTQGAQSLHLLGSKVSTNNNMALDVNATNAIQHLKQEVIRLQTENKKLTDQLNCFISLVQRSWKGDTFATTHLSNIVGCNPLKQNSSVNDGMQARPNSQIDLKNRSQKNWEHLAKKLLDREYETVQEEIREYQQRYIQNRQLYMDAVMYDHQQSMSVLPLSRKSDHHGSVENVDSRFIKHTKAIERMGIPHRQNRRAQSAKMKKRTMAQDQVRGMDISLRDLVGEKSSSNHFLDTQASKEAYTITPSQLKQRPHTSNVKPHFPNTYNDPTRYAQGNLYGMKDAEVIKKARPVSASILREGDYMRSRPRSGSIGKRDQIGSPAFMTQKNERSLKYEATRPVYSRPKSSKPRQKSAKVGHSSVLRRSNSHTGLTAQTDVISASSVPISAQDVLSNRTEQRPEPFQQEYGNGMPSVESTSTDHLNGTRHDNSFNNEDEGLPPKPAISVRVKSAFNHRPAHIDKFAEEERKMHDLEDDFRKTALGLQKKLGIEDRGMVIFD